MTDLVPLEAALGRVTGLGELEASWRDVIRELLRFSSLHPVDSDAWERESGLVEHWIAVAQTSVSRRVEAAAGTLLAQMTGLAQAPVALRDVLVEATFEAAEDLLPLAGDSDLASALAAYGAAQAVDHLFGEALLDQYRNEPEFVVSPGTLYPRPRRDPRAWVGRFGLSSDPTQLPSRSLDATSTFAVGPQVTARIPITIDFDAWNRLAPITTDKPLVVAALQPTLALAEYDLVLDPDNATFTNRGIRDEAATVQVLVRQVLGASGHGAQVVVAPEYTLSEGAHLELVLALEPRLLAPLVLVAGVHGTGAPGVVSNTAFLTVFTPGMRSFTSLHPHRKLFPATYRGMTERMATGVGIRVYVSRSWSAVNLICLDSMVPDIVEPLAAASPDLLVVPAMTPKTATMRGTFAGMAARCQTFSVLASAPQSWADEESTPPRGPGQVESVFAAPRETGEPVVSCPPDATDVSAPERGYWLHDFPENTVVWHACD